MYGVKLAIDHDLGSNYPYGLATCIYIVKLKEYVGYTLHS